MKIKKDNNPQYSDYYLLSISIINAFIDSGKPFLSEQVCQVILFAGGILRVSLLRPITEYLNDLVEEDILTNNRGWYEPGKKLLSLEGFPPKAAAQT